MEKVCYHSSLSVQNLMALRSGEIDNVEGSGFINEGV